MKPVIFSICVLLCVLSGCGSRETVLPKEPFTAEQIAAIKAEDAAVADEESQGKLPKKKVAK
jgi:hypothetical protein